MERNHPERGQRFLDKKAVGRLQNVLIKHARQKMSEANNSRRGRGGRGVGGGGRGRGRGPPPGLRGKDIGLFYKQRQIERNQESKLETSVTLPSDTLKNVETILKEYDQRANASDLSEFEEYFKSIKTTNFEEHVKSKVSEDGMENDEKLDEQLYCTYNEMIVRPKYINASSTRTSMPVYSRKDEILDAIEANQVVLISGDTGCGKTTQIPQYILDLYLSSKRGSLCKIFCTQPRRISAITVAERVAWERCECIGESIGYQIRLQNIFPRERGSITYCTTGILLKRLESDPLLNGISHIFLDEVHERDVNTDVVMGLLKRITSYRPDLKVVLMSATFSIETFSKYFNDCLTITVHGTLFPVKDVYLEDILEEIKFANFPEPRRRKEKKWEKYRNKNKTNFDPVDDFEGFIKPYARSIQDQYSKFVIEGICNPSSEEINTDLLCALILHISSRKPDGAILVFLPGYDIISSLHTKLTQNKFFRSEKMRVFGLHSMMPTAEQKSVFQKPPDGVRKIILSTNIAETSITIDDVVYVIDTGKIKTTEYNIETNLQTLLETWATIANIKQRKGRAGRVQPGVCYHLFTRAREYTMKTFPTPEILRSRLESVILNLKMLHIHNVAQFFTTLISIPDDSIVKISIKLLRRLNALDEIESITPLGLHLARLPVDPQIGKMILMSSIFKCVDPITTVAACLSFKDPFYRPLGKEKEVDNVRQRYSHGTKSDHLLISNILTEYRESIKRGNERHFCYNNFLSESILRQIENMKRQFCDILMNAKFLDDSDPLNRGNNKNSHNIDLLRSIIGAGLYPNIAKVRKIKIVRNRAEPVINVVTPEDGRVSFHPSSINSKQTGFDDKFFVYFMKQKSSAIYLFDTTMINPLSLLIFGDGDENGFDDHGTYFMGLADRFRFKTNHSSAEVILKLRENLDELLRKKAINPSPIDPESEDTTLINAVIEVLSAHRNQRYSESSDED